MAALAQRGGVTAEIALSEGSAPSLALLQLQQALQWVPSQAGRECALYTAQTLTALAASGASWSLHANSAGGIAQSQLELQQSPAVGAQPAWTGVCALHCADAHSSGCLW